MADTKILIVENTKAFDREIEIRLKTLGYAVCTSASSGAQAIEEISEMQPDMVMVKLGLESAMPAVEAAEEIYYKLNIPVMFLVDSITENVLEKIKRAGVFGHVFKPFDANQLYLGIEQHLRWHREITKHKTNEEQSYRTISELRHETQLMKTVFDSMYDGIVVLSLEGEILFINPSIRQLFGTVPLGELRSEWSKTHGVFYPDKETRIPIDQILSTHIAQGVAIRDEELFIRNEQRTEGVHIRASAIPLFDENQKAVACVCVIRDITKDKIAAIRLEQAVQKLQNQVQLTNTIFNSISDGVIAADANGAFTIFNPSAERILGMGPIDKPLDKRSEHYGLFFPDKATPFAANEPSARTRS